MLVYDIIKIKYIREGFLPNYPYHLISDKEMCDAFIKPGGYFDTMYPNWLDDSEPYDKLKRAINYHIDAFLLNTVDSEERYEIPDWVCTYMLGKVISSESDFRDIDTLVQLFQLEAIPKPPNTQISELCLATSKEWLQKTQSPQIVSYGLFNAMDARPPTQFGEPHVIKSLRISEVRPN